MESIKKSRQRLPQCGDLRIVQPSELARIRHILPKAHILALFEKGPIRPKALVAKLHPSHVGIRFDCMTKNIVNAFHAAGVITVVYTINAPRGLLRMMDIEVDGIISDYPSLLTDN